MNDLVLQEQVGPVLRLTLNRPGRHNSLIPELLQALLAALEESVGQAEIKAVVLQASGRSFSTGGDARGFVEHKTTVAAYARQLVGLLNQVILGMVDLPVPIVTAVHGIVTGGSLGLVLASDIVLVAPEATFTPYYSAIGPSPDGGWATLLPLLIGQKRAAEALFCNRSISAAEAVAWGLANRIVPAGTIHEEALRQAQQVASLKLGSIRHTRRLLYYDREEIALRLEAERERFVEHIVTDEAIGGFERFLQARTVAT